MIDNPYLDHPTRRKIQDMLNRLENEAATRRTVETRLAAVEAQLEHRRKNMEMTAARLDITVPGLRFYAEWRKKIDGLSGTGRWMLGDRGVYGMHLDGSSAAGSAWGGCSRRSARRCARTTNISRELERRGGRARTQEEIEEQARKNRKGQRKGRGMSM